MSTTIGLIHGRRGATDRQGPGLRDKLYLTRFMGGGDGTCLQLSAGDLYVQLDAAGVQDLRLTLEEWLTLDDCDA